MTGRLLTFLLMHSIVGLALAIGASAYAETDFLAEPTWQPVENEVVHARLVTWLEETDIGPELRADILDQWWSMGDAPEGNAGPLDRLASCLSGGESRVAELLSYCSGISAKVNPLQQEFTWLADSQTHPLVRHNMRLYYARWLVQEGFYDEAISWTDGLATTDVVAPDLLLFYRAVAQHRLVHPEEAIDSLEQLLEREYDLPHRYQKLAQLMLQDLVGLKDDSLDHIARRMVDIGRRLAQGRSDEPVQKVEKGVIDSLDKLIKKLEEQQQQAMQAGSSSGSSGTPMEESRLAELKAPGNVDRKDIGSKVDWGDLPPKEREQAMQEIGRDFPSHYREVIEEYFRRLAGEESKDR